MPHCHDCNRYFKTSNGYYQHINSSDAHRSNTQSGPDWECDYCYRCFGSESARGQHYRNASGHPYCSPCDRMFQNENNLNQHRHGRAHMGNSIECPFCKNSYTTASGVTIHLESGTCISGLNRAKINDIVQNLDRNNVITRPMLTMPGYDRGETIATSRSWNGNFFQCYLCGKEFTTLNGLNQHIQSPAHEQPLYRCPKSSCARPFKVLSGLVQHVESETCGIMRFTQVQQQARNGIQNMVGRMISA